MVVLGLVSTWVYHIDLVMKASFLAGVSFALANVLGVEECL